MRFPIKYKLVAIILIIFIPLIGLSVHHYFELIEHDKQDIEFQNLDMVTSITKSLDDEIGDSFSLIETLAKYPAVIAKNTEECDRFFTEILPLYPNYLNILTVDMGGRTYCSGVHSPDIGRLNHKDSSWFQKASKGAPVIDDIQTSGISSDLYVMLAMPIFDRNRKQIGVLGLPLNLIEIRNDLKTAMQAHDRSSIIVVDSKGNVIVDTLNAETIGSNIIERPVIRKAFSVTTGGGEGDGKDGVKRIYSFAPMSKTNWKVFVGMPADDVFRHAHLFGEHYLRLIIIAGLMVLAMALLLTRRITRKVLSLSSGMKEIEKGNLDFQLQPKGSDELSDLARSFNDMAEKRKSAEQRLTTSQAFLTSVLDGIGEGLVVIDRDFKILSANRQYCEQVKMPCEIIIDRYCYEISHHIVVPCHEKADGCECTVKKCFDTGSHHHALHTHFDKEGNPRYIETNAYPIKDESGHIVSAIETMMDVTDKVVLEKKWETVREQYRKLYDDAPDMMHSIGRDGTIIICNKTEAKNLGYDINDIIGQHFLKIIVPEERDVCMQKFEVIQKNGFLEGDMTLLAKDGRHVPVFMRSKAMYDENGDFLMTDAILRDVTEKKLLEAQLYQAQKMESIGQLAGGIAHDFNNILTAIIGFGSLLKPKLGEDATQLGYLSQILSAADRAAHLTKSLLAFSRKQLIDMKRVRLNEIITRTEKLLQRIIGEDIELKTFLSPQEAAVLVDAGQIEQVLMNLSSNARDAMPDGGTLMIETEIVVFDEEYIKTHDFAKAGKYMLVSVTDTGIGMDEETTAKIFDPFFTTKEIGKGTGLGLAMVYGIIRQHEGSINVYSEKGRGTTFKIYLPVVEGEAEAVEAKPASVFSPITRGTETILVAEDESSLREYTIKLLEDQGYRVIAAENGEDAIEKFRTYANAIDLLIFDVIMPRKNGKEAYDEIRKQRPEIKALFMSGYTANIIHNKGILKAGIELITKPFTPTSLLKKVRIAMDKK